MVEEARSLIDEVNMKIINRQDCYKLIENLIQDYHILITPEDAGF